ncbi:hypothetical protein [uncultured Tateyamaria sp.]|uniref:hypothetical protein n=1 Tax=uncultured Tateyamaria sp. TaxID=455651 RepID=UPI002617F7A8|nr:hypothetical protein [uncultured Tateyamaria sp.]
MFDRIETDNCFAALEHAVQARLVHETSRDVLDRTEKSIRAYMADRGIDFEGRALPMSLRPLVMDEGQVAATAQNLRLVRAGINRIIVRTRADIRSNADTVLTRFFGGYSKWFDLIAAEERRLPDVMLMRFDTAFDRETGWQAMEPNAACPGGVIHCAYLRAAWQDSDLGAGLTEAVPIVERAIDDASGFVRFLEGVIKAPDGDRHAVICNYDGTYTNELDSLVRRAAIDRAAGQGALTISTADIRALEQVGDEIHLNGRRVDLIYNKLDPLEIDPQDPDTTAWRAASHSKHCTFLNSFGAMYIGEAKSMFAALSDPAIAAHAGLTVEERAAVETCVLSTRRVRDLAPALRAKAVADRAAWVLKEDATTRGIGVELGDAHGADDWAALLADYAPRNGVIQRAVATPRRARSGNAGEEFFGADWFFFGDSFAGCVSRAHVNKVFNVGNGGCEVPVLVVQQEAKVEAVSC